MTSPKLLKKTPFPVIAIATSVGGLHALSVILAALPKDFPAAILIVMHLSPLHKSLLAHILSSRTPLKVKEAKEGEKIMISCVYVAPPNRHLFVTKGGILMLSSIHSEKIHHVRPSAEPLFVSVALLYRNHAIAIVLTGGDGDGSRGVECIHKAGGTVIAQNQESSEDFSMPETSIKTGNVDYVLLLSEIAAKLRLLVGSALESEMQPL